MKGDIYDLRSAKAMLLTESSPFDSKDHLFELKLDGIRCLAYLEPGQVDLRNKRNKNLNEIYPELAGIDRQISKRCILDGELVVMNQGMPDFFALQKRSLMTNQFKISLLASKQPVQLIVYDILYLDDKDITDTPLMERKQLLEGVVVENDQIIRSRYILDQGINFYQLVAKQKLEGVVAKQKNSIYQQGKRSKYWLKFKRLVETDCVICGVILTDDGTIKSVALGLYDQDQLIPMGHVAMGISKQDEGIILKHLRERRCEYSYDLGSADDSTLYCEPKLVCIVSHMMQTEHGFRQPVFKGLRNDKVKEECTTKQFT